jgi:hypothetical protein
MTHHPLDVHERIRRVRVTGPMAVCFVALMLGVPFAIGWALDDGSWNQPFPRGLRRLVLAAAALHFGSIGWRVLRAATTWEPIAPILWRLLVAYALLAFTGAAAWYTHERGVDLLTHVILTLPAGWGLYLLARAMSPAGAVDDRSGGMND